MKKVYILLFAAAFSLSATAQKTTTKKIKKSTTTKQVNNVAAMSTNKTAPVATVTPVMDAHNANDVQVAAAAVKPAGEDNLQIEMTHDFGKIPQGKPVTFDFSIKNTGKTELQLEQVQAGCGCTTPTWQPGPYAAGTSSVIKVGYNAANPGSFSKPVTITYNGGLTKVITITGEVVAAPPAPAPENKAVEVLKPSGK